MPCIVDILARFDIVVVVSRSSVDSRDCSVVVINRSGELYLCVRYVLSIRSLHGVSSVDFYPD